MEGEMAERLRCFLVILTAGSSGPVNRIVKRTRFGSELANLAEAPLTAVPTRISAAPSAFCGGFRMSAKALLSALMEALSRPEAGPGRLSFLREKDEIVVIEMGAEHAASDDATDEAIRQFKEKTR
jgi:hypothetical protein